MINETQYHNINPTDQVGPLCDGDRAPKIEIVRK